MFCSKCGSKLADDALFCSKCGNRVQKTIENPILEDKSSELTNQKNRVRDYSEEDRITALLNKHLKEIVQNEKQLLIVPEDERIINAFPTEVIQKYTHQKPLLAFNYMNDGMKDGFIITETEFISIYGGRKNSLLLKDVRFANLFKAGLATVMTLFKFSDGCSSDIYLTGIMDTKKLLSGVNAFFMELNQKELYDKQEEKIQAKDIKTILSVSFKDYIGDYTYCSIGTPISTGHAKYKSAINNFNLDVKNEIFMIYDESIWGNCKKGFLVTYQGIYHKQKNSVGFISWDEFKTLKLSAGLVLSIGSLDFATLKKDCTIAYTVLSNLQKMLMD